MEKAHTPTIRRLVEHHGGPAAFARKLAEGFPYQEVQRWVKRGWASPMHALKIEPLLLPGMTIRDLHVDKDKAEGSAEATA